MAEEKKQPADNPAGNQAGKPADNPKDNQAGKESKKEVKEIEVPKKFKALVEEIEKMPIIELAELVKILEEKFGVSAMPQVVAGAGAPASAEAAADKEEKSSYNIELTKVGDKKIDVIKVIRDVTEKGLKESKELVDAAGSSAQVVKENVKKEEAEEIKKKFTAAGATVELK